MIECAPRNNKWNAENERSKRKIYRTFLLNYLNAAIFKSRLIDVINWIPLRFKI